MSQSNPLTITTFAFAALTDFLGSNIMGQDLIPYKKQAIHGILDNDAEAVAEAFKKNPDLVSDETSGYQPWICHAVSEGNMAVVEAVIAAGCNINGLSTKSPTGDGIVPSVRQLCLIIMIWYHSCLRKAQTQTWGVHFSPPSIVVNEPLK